MLGGGPGCVEPCYGDPSGQADDDESGEEDVMGMREISHGHGAGGFEDTADPLWRRVALAPRRCGEGREGHEPDQHCAVERALVQESQEGLAALGAFLFSASSASALPKTNVCPYPVPSVGVLSATPLWSC